MFLTIASLAARRSGKSEIVIIAENGQMAIHLPLSVSRIGALSTHTTHPEFVFKVGSYFTNLLSFPVRIENPYLYKTKAETVSKLVKDHRQAVEMSVSCWRGSRLSKDFNHYFSTARSTLPALQKSIVAHSCSAVSPRGAPGLSNSYRHS